MHKIHQKKSTPYSTLNKTGSETEPDSSPTPDNIPGPDPETDPDSILTPDNIPGPEPHYISNFNINSVYNSDPPSASSSIESPSAMTLANILRDFDDTEDEEVCKSSHNNSEIECEADNEEDDDDSSVPDGHMSRQPGQRYTEFDFDFLQEEWLQSISDTSDAISSVSDDDISSVSD